MSIIIIGSGISAVSALEAIRRREPDTQITLITAESVPFYYRPMIPMIVSGKKSIKDIGLPHDPVKSHRVMLIRGVVDSIDTAEKRVVLSDGRALHYDRLLIASGSRPNLRSFRGAEGVGLFTLRTIDDAQKMRQAADNAKRAVIIGGGFIGVKASEALVHKGLKVTLIEQRPTILYPRTDSVASDMVASRLRAAGVEVIAGAMTDAIIRENGAVKGVMLGSHEIPADMVVAATGTTPRLEFIKSSGIKYRTGILTNAHLETAVPGVFAVGDVVECRDTATGTLAVSALWSDAVEMGRTAGANLSGGRESYNGMLSVKNASDIMGLPIVSAGIVDGVSGLYAEVAKREGDTYRKVLFDNDRAVGAVFVGDLRGAGVITNLIKNRIPGGRDKALRYF